MSKRFIDTEMFDDPWFMDLSKDGKIAFMYFITKCNHAGILTINQKLFTFQTGVNWLSVTKELAKCLVTVKDDVYFMPKYITFQYPNWPNSKVKQQESAIKILLSFNLLNENNLTVKQQLPNYYDNDNDSVNDSVSVNKEKDTKKFLLSLDNLNSILKSHKLEQAIKSLSLKPEVGKYIFKNKFWVLAELDGKEYESEGKMLSHFMNWYNKAKPEMTESDKAEMNRNRPRPQYNEY